jgi:hypothetical protein
MSLCEKLEDIDLEVLKELIRETVIDMNKKYNSLFLIIPDDSSPPGNGFYNQILLRILKKIRWPL